VLASRGRFVEIGKRGIWSQEQVAAVRPDAAYHVLAVDDLATSDPARVGALLRELMDRFETGALQPIVRTVYPLAEARAAFAHMQQGRHIGKIVLQVPQSLAFLLRPDACYLITGGLGGLGLLTAQRLVEQGARHLVLVGRSAPSGATQERIAALERS